MPYFFGQKPTQPVIQRGHPLNDGLLCAWLFHERGGQTFRDVLGENTAQATVSPYTYNIGRGGRLAAVSNGSAGYAVMTRVPKLGTGDFSIFAWLNFSGGGRKGVVSYGGTGTNNGTNLFLNASGQVEFDLSNVAGPHSTTVLTANVWTLIGVTCRAGVVQCYVDNKPDGSTSSMSPNITDPGSNRGYISRDLSPAVMSGSIDEVRIWGRAINPGEVARLYYSDYSEFRVPRSHVSLLPAVAAASPQSAVSIIT